MVLRAAVRASSGQGSHGVARLAWSTQCGQSGTRPKSPRWAGVCSRSLGRGEPAGVATYLPRLLDHRHRRLRTALQRPGLQTRVGCSAEGWVPGHRVLARLLTARRRAATTHTAASGSGRHQAATLEALDAGLGTNRLREARAATTPPGWAAVVHHRNRFQLRRTATGRLSFPAT
jgi:hypothetical protein